jgi:hypothetical protein
VQHHLHTGVLERYPQVVPVCHTWRMEKNHDLGKNWRMEFKITIR